MNWRRHTLNITVLGMESCWLYALLLFLNHWVAQGRLSIFWLWLLFPLAYICNRVLGRLRWPRGYIYAANGFAAVIGALLLARAELYAGYGLLDPSWVVAWAGALVKVLHGFPPELLILAGGALLWWRGWHLARREVSFAISVTEFQFGVAILLIMLFLASLTEVVLGNASWLVLAFLGFALVGMAMARSQDTVGHWTGPQRRHWTGLLLVATGLVLLLGTLIGSLVTVDLLQLFLTALRWMGGLAMKAFLFLAGLLPASPAPSELPSMTPLPGGGEEAFRQTTRAWWSETLRTVLGFVVLSVLIGLTVAALWRVSAQVWGWLRRMLGAAPGGTFEPLPGAFKEDLLKVLRGFVQGLVSLGSLVRRSLVWRARRVDPSQASIRELYRRFLRWAAAAGWPRALSQTPYEYAATLAPLLSTDREPLDQLTEAYVRACYGPSPLTKEELHEVRERWHMLKRSRLKRPGRGTVPKASFGPQDRGG